MLHDPESKAPKLSTRMHIAMTVCSDKLSAPLFKYFSRDFDLRYCMCSFIKYFSDVFDKKDKFDEIG